MRVLTRPPIARSASASLWIWSASFARTMNGTAFHIHYWDNTATLSEIAARHCGIACGSMSALFSLEGYPTGDYPIVGYPTGGCSVRGYSIRGYFYKRLSLRYLPYWKIENILELVSLKRLFASSITVPPPFVFSFLYILHKYCGRITDNRA